MMAYERWVVEPKQKILSILSVKEKMVSTYSVHSNKHVMLLTHSTHTIHILQFDIIICSMMIEELINRKTIIVSLFTGT